MVQNIKLERPTLGCYKDPMPKEKRSELVGAMVTETAKTRLEEIATGEDRSLSYVASALLMRGLAAFERDGKLIEAVGSGDIQQPSTIRVPTKNLGDKKDGKGRKAS